MTQTAKPARPAPSPLSAATPSGAGAILTPPRRSPRAPVRPEALTLAHAQAILVPILGRVRRACAGGDLFLIGAGRRPVNGWDVRVAAAALANARAEADGTEGDDPDRAALWPALPKPGDA